MTEVASVLSLKFAVEKLNHSSQKKPPLPLLNQLNHERSPFEKGETGGFEFDFVAGKTGLHLFNAFQGQDTRGSRQAQSLSRNSAVVPSKLKVAHRATH